jgi:hypothetical protein
MRTKFWLESLQGRDHSKDLGVYGRIILKWILGKEMLRVYNGFIWLRTETSDGSL